MQKILLPTDFSDNAWNAIFTAVKLYAEVECTFYLLHTYEPGTLNMLGHQRHGLIYGSLAEYADQELMYIMHYFNQNHRAGHHRFETISEPGLLEGVVKELVKKKEMDLVVMGTQGATAAKNIFMGSNTVKVLKKIKKCPVLIVPSDYNFQKLKSVAFLTDFTKTYEKFELVPLIELVALWKAEIHVLYVAVEFMLTDAQTIHRRMIRERLTAVDPSFQNVPLEVSITSSAEKYIVGNQVDMMAMIRYHHSFWEDIIREPVVKKIAFRSKVPVLMLPEKR